MRVSVRRRTTLSDGTEIDQEIELSAEGSYAPDVCTDLVARAFELWGWVLGEDEEEAES